MHTLRFEIPLSYYPLLLTKTKNKINPKIKHIDRKYMVWRYCVKRHFRSKAENQNNVKIRK